MRPIRLKIQAFGPYAGSETIDFREALKSGLFGIYGSTGSGKSSIFSAMTFALFGEAARDDQDVSTLRSDHAAADCPTEVEFIFEVGEKRFLIRRRPEQMRPKKHGDGETRDMHQAWLFDVTGIELQDIGSDNIGKIIAEKKVGLVQAAVIERLNYGPEQFRQIVLLPQGKFETFLTAKTEERLSILRDLFDVSLYRRIAEKMKDDARVAEESVRSDRELCARRLMHEGFESPDALVTGIEDQAAVHSILVATAVTKRKAASEAENELANAKRIDEKFRELDSSETSMTALVVKAEEIAGWKEKCRTLVAAKALLDSDDAVSRSNIEVMAASLAVKAADADRYAAAKAAEIAADALILEKSKEDELTALRHKFEELSRYKKTIEDARTFRIDAEKAEDVREKAKKKRGDAVDRHNLLTTTGRRLEGVLVVAENQTEERESLSVEFEKAKQAYKNAADYEKKARLVRETKDKLENEIETQTGAIAKLGELTTKFEQAELSLSGAQAVHLAEKLSEGQACQVCGSLDHPNPARGSVESASLDKNFRDAKSKLDRARTAEGVSRAAVAAAEAKLGERTSALSALEKPKQTAENYQHSSAEWSRKLEDMGEATDIVGLKTKIGENAEKIVSAQESTETARQEFESANTKAAVAEQKLSDALQSIPENLRDATALSAALNDTLQLIKSYEDALSQAEHMDKAARDTALSASKDFEAAIKLHKNAVARSKRDELIFAERLEEAKLSRTDYETAKPQIDKIEDLQKSIGDYEKEVAVAVDKVKTASAAVAGLERQELEPLRTTAESAAKVRDDATAEASKAESRGELLQDLLRSISNELDRIKKLEKETSPLRDLAAMFNANNSARLKLETFAIGAMFDQVLIAANLRLGPMSSGRFSLVRDQEGGKGQSRRGLGMLVHDVYTGRQRHTSTLSGGETFIAALALALGLSDIVENVGGGVRLDTIFIDEGFGSLDTENDSGTLDQVLQSLTDLVGHRRAVGLISHVPLVQQTIPNGFWVTKTPTGSHIEERGDLA